MEDVQQVVRPTNPFSAFSSLIVEKSGKNFFDLFFFFASRFGNTSTSSPMCICVAVKSIIKQVRNKFCSSKQLGPTQTDEAGAEVWMCLTGKKTSYSIVVRRPRTVFDPKVNFLSSRLMGASAPASRLRLFLLAITSAFTRNFSPWLSSWRLHNRARKL